MIRTDGRSALRTPATPPINPPPPTGTITVATSGRSSSSSRPERALTGDDPRVVERVDEDGAGLLGALAGRGDAVVDRRAAELHRSPDARTAATLATAASAGMKSSHGMPLTRAA